MAVSRRIPPLFTPTSPPQTFRRMKAEGKKRGVSKGSPYLSTHPADDDRIAKQEEWMDAAVQVTSLAPGRTHCRSHPYRHVQSLIFVASCSPVIRMRAVFLVNYYAVPNLRACTVHSKRKQSYTFDSDSKCFSKPTMGVRSQRPKGLNGLAAVNSALRGNLNNQVSLIFSRFPSFCALPTEVDPE